MILLPGGAGAAQRAAAESSQRSSRGAVSVAVAANFADVHAQLAARFSSSTGHRVITSAGSSGQLYAQIMSGAPFEVFLSADTARPAQLERDGLTVAGTRFTYAVGRLALFGPSLDSVRADGEDLRAARFAHVAIANPTTAPYGAAAVQVIARLGLTQALRDRLVQGESIAQTFQFVKSGAAELGFVAWSQVVRERRHRYWLVPAEQHDVIAQDAVLLRRGAANAAARAYIEFLRGDLARRMIAAQGYELR
jgi:molybdate transport system substrate-binding protein